MQPKHSFSSFTNDYVFFIITQIKDARKKYSTYPIGLHMGEKSPSKSEGILAKS